MMIELERAEYTGIIIGDILARTVKQRDPGHPRTATMADSFTRENAALVMDILGSLEQFVGESKKDKSKHNIENFKQRTTDMAVVVPHAEMGKLC
eukprot:6123100-Heterocapsa_arctica.AAC.1